MSRPNLFELPIWSDFEQRVHEIFSRALLNLAQQPRLPREEDPLNRRLLHFCRQANFELRREGRGLPCPIFYEASNQPVADDPERASRLRKRPDFQCGYHDDQADNAEESELFYTIECKRLGQPTRSDWVLNLNYVVNGINRFIRAEWAYAKGASSGMMIGYLQSMEPEAILSEVNQNAEAHDVPAIILAPRTWTIQGLTVLNPHPLRRDIELGTFLLSHHWIDLRHPELFEATPKKPPKPTRKRPKKKSGADTPTPSA